MSLVTISNQKTSLVAYLQVLRNAVWLDFSSKRCSLPLVEYIYIYTYSHLEHAVIHTQIEQVGYKTIHTTHIAIYLSHPHYTTNHRWDIIHWTHLRS